MEQVNERYEKLREEYESLANEKSGLGTQLTALQKENDSIKLKFAHLLDLFQEYVN